MEEHEASPNMRKFFDNLIDIKQFVKQKLDETNDELIKEIYERLDKVIKSTEE